MEKTFKVSDFQRWGSKGGKKRAQNLTPERRLEIALKAGLVAAEARKKKCTPQTT